MIHKTATDFVQLASKYGVSKFVICPGSRSAPLTLALNRHADIETFVLADERSAAYVALGLAQASGETVGLVCTSGTAVLNFYPAVAEAFYQQIPLLVCTADRPFEWIDQQDGQTLNQHQVFGSHVNLFLRMPEQYENQDIRKHMQFRLHEAIDTCRQKGPVHINFPFREPLYPALDEMLVFEEARVIQTVGGAASLSKEQLNPLMNAWLAAPKKMLVAGQMPWSQALRDAVYACRYYNSIPVLADVISNLHGIEKVITDHDWFLGQLAEEQCEDLRPDLLITFGNSLISKNLKQFIRNFPPTQHWHIQPEGHVADTFRTVTHIIRHDVSSFVTKLGEHGYYARFNEPETPYFQQWEDLNAQTKKQVELEISHGGWNEFKAAQQIVSQLPEPGFFHVANSMPIRYANFFNNFKPNLRITSNRGTSGIDGCVSTAVGHSLATSEPIVLLVGDVAFFYDRNGLWHKHLKPNLKIILLNNQGGNIFRMIDGPARQPELEEFFETEQTLDASHLCQEKGFNYFPVSSKQDLEQSWLPFMSASSSPALLEVFTDKKDNAAFFKAIKSSLKQYFELPETTDEKS